MGGRACPPPAPASALLYRCMEEGSCHAASWLPLTGGEHKHANLALPPCSRVGKAEQTLYAGGDKEHKAQLKLATNAVRAGVSACACVGVGSSVAEAVCALDLLPNRQGSHVQLPANPSSATNNRVNGGVLPPLLPPLLPFPVRQGYAVSVRSKLHRGPLLHSAAAAFSEVGGLHLSAKSKFSDGTKVKTSYSLRSEVLSVAGGGLGGAGTVGWQALPIPPRSPSRRGAEQARAWHSCGPRPQPPSPHPPAAKHKARGLSASDADATLTLAMDIPLGQRRDPRVRSPICCGTVGRDGATLCKGGPALVGLPCGPGHMLSASLPTLLLPVQIVLGAKWDL